jgi:hypothetical protein
MDAMTWLRAQWDRVAGFGLIGLGGLALLLGFRGVSNSGYVADQLTYIISGGLGGLFLLGCGAVLLLIAEMRDEWRKLDGIEALLRGELGADDHPQDQGPTAETRAKGSTAMAARPRGTRLQALPAAAKPTLMTDAGALPAAFTPVTAVALGAALLAMALAYAGVDGQRDIDAALRSTGWAVTALIAAAIVVGTSTFVAQRRMRIRQSELFAPFLLRSALRATQPRYLTERARHEGETVVLAPGLTRYHRPSCPAVAGLDVEAMSAADAARSATPCGLCC